MHGRRAWLPWSTDAWRGSARANPAPESWSPATQLVLAPFQGWHYVLQSLEQLRSSGDLARLPLDNRAAATLRLQAERMPADLLRRFRREWARFAGAGNAATRRVLHTWTGALLTHMGGADSALAGLEGLKGDTDMATVSEALFDEWFADIRAQHVAEGMERGIEQGVQQERARGLARLRRQAAIKFGAATAERLLTVLAAAGPRAMDRMGDQASDWIVECGRGEDLLSRAAALVDRPRLGSDK